MASYGFRCSGNGGHEIIGYYPMGKAPSQEFCNHHQAYAHRTYEAPQFTEDRRRMQKCSNPAAPSDRWSWSLGQDMPETRSEQRRLEREKGIEMLTRDEARREANEAKGYLEAVRSGSPPAPEQPKPLPKGWLAKEVAERGIRFGSGESHGEVLTPENSDRKIAETTEWSDQGSKIIR